jgi:hypothetical protein
MVKVSRLVKGLQRNHLRRVLAGWEEGDRRRLAALLDRLVLVADMQTTPFEAGGDG